MYTNSFKQEDSYEWSGIFWFPDSFEEKFAGKMTYTPEEGGRLKLCATLENLLKDTLRGRYKKTMLALVNQAPWKLSILNVYILPTIEHNFVGKAQFIISGHINAGLALEGIMLQYDELFENLFFRPINRERDIISFGGGTQI